MAKQITTTFSSQPWKMNPAQLGAALEHDHAVTQLTFKGDIEGSGTGSYVVTYLPGHDGKKAHFTYSGQIIFEGAILGKKGTIIIREGGFSTGDRFHSDWILDTISGAGELQGLAGEGSYDAKPGLTKTDQEVRLTVSFP